MISSTLNSTERDEGRNRRCDPFQGMGEDDGGDMIRVDERFISRSEDLKVGSHR